jgi:hypothetical protein
MRIAFPDGLIEPAVKWSREKRNWVLCDDIFFRVNGTLEIIHAGMITDLASVPCVFRSIINTYGNYNLAAIIHDHLYAHKGVLQDGTKLTRAQCDEIFLRVMLRDQVPCIEATIMWLAVRLNPFNWPLFKKW